MGISKTNLFTPPQNELAELAKALSHPARIAIIEYLIQHDTCICQDVVDAIPLAQPTIAQHINVLRKSGILHNKTKSQKQCLVINKRIFEKFRNKITFFCDGLIESETCKSN